MSFKFLIQDQKELNVQYILNILILLLRGYNSNHHTIYFGKRLHRGRTDYQN